MPKYMPRQTQHQTNMDQNKSKESSVTLNYPMLTKSNYTAWAMKMIVFMQAHGVWEAIEPKDPAVAVEEKKVLNGVLVT